jgi:BTB/POZ domain
MPNADVILQSFSLVDFYVHRSVLIASSPFFRDMFSLPQPPNGVVPNPLPVVHLSENAETLDSLISMLYPVPPEMPPSSDNDLALLAAAAKYDMDAVQYSIRVEINRRGLLSSTPAELFRVYAVACSNGLIPEMESSARLTLAYPLTFESLGDALRSFEGRALRDLADFHLRSIRDFASNSKPFIESLEGPSKIWAGCPMTGWKRPPYWLEDCLWFKLSGFGSADSVTNTIPTDAQLRDKYLKALQRHVKERDCNSCLMVHALEGEEYCEKLKDVLVQVRNVPILMLEG